MDYPIASFSGSDVDFRFIDEHISPTVLIFSFTLAECSLGRQSKQPAVLRIDYTIPDFYISNVVSVCAQLV
jgi:hypothetical protein